MGLTRRSRLLPLALVTAAFGLPGCGDGDTQTITLVRPATTGGEADVSTTARPADDRAGIVEAIRGYFDAAADKDGDRACALLTEAGRETLLRETRVAGGPEDDCSAAAVAYADVFGSSLRNVRVQQIRVQGERATAIANFVDASSTERYQLREQDGAWKIDKWGSTD